MATTRYRLGSMVLTAAAAAAAAAAAVVVWAQPALGACGSWQKIPGAPGVHGVLADVSASSATDVWAVGVDDGRTLAERWDGSTWRRVAAPNPGRRSTRVDKLSAVVAIAPDDAWAVGEFGRRRASLLLHWNGVRWQRRILPRAARYAALFDIVAVSAGDVWAVGTSGQALTLRTLHYDGSRWRVVPAVNRGVHPTFLSVAATSSSDVWAVGYSPRTLVEHWDGHAWHLVAASRWGGPESGVAAISPSDVWGVGYTQHGQVRVIDHWDGSSWTIAFSAAGVRLNSVAASGPNDAWAVGGVLLYPGGPTIVHWNGTTWSQSVMPTPGPAFLSSVVDVATTSSYWAVGATYHRVAHTAYNTPRFEFRC